MDRRLFLTTVAAPVLCGTSGCLDIFEEDAEEICPDGSDHLENLITDMSLRDDQLNGITLTSTPSEVVPVRTPEFTVRLMNERSTTFEIEGKDRYAIQRYAGDGWKTVTGVRPNHEWDEGTMTLAPGESVSWELKGERGGMDYGPVEMCLLPGPDRYRFVYWGIPETDTALYTEFEIASYSSDD